MIEVINPTDLTSPGPIGGTTPSSAAFKAITAASTTSDAIAATVTDGTGAFVGYRVTNLSSGSAAFSGLQYFDHTSTIGVFQGYNNSTKEFRINVTQSGATLNFLLTSASALKFDTNLGATISSTLAVPAGGQTGAGYKLYSTANLGVFGGSGVPTLGAAQGSLYLRTDGSSTTSRMYVATSTASSSASWASMTASS